MAAEPDPKEEARIAEHRSEPGRPWPARIPYRTVGRLRSSAAGDGHAAADRHRRSRRPCDHRELPLRRVPG